MHPLSGRGAEEAFAHYRSRHLKLGSVTAACLQGLTPPPTAGAQRGAAAPQPPHLPGHGVDGRMMTAAKAVHLLMGQK